MKYWNSPETTSVNREPMLNISHEDFVSLDGQWDFQLLRSPDDQPGRSWTTIPVPGLWTTQEESHHFWDRPIYTNVQMPFDDLPPFVPALNPTGIYERDFTVLDNWVGERIVLQIGGFESVAILSVNGVEVGMAKDSRLAADFEISDFVNPGKNRIQIKVVKWSDATYIEDQDQWWHGGITRSIKLFITPRVHISRFYPTAGLKSDGTTGTLDIRAFVAAAQDANFEGYSLVARVEGVARAKAMSAKVIGTSRIEWTEMPAEYQAIARDFFHGTYWDGKVPASIMEVVNKIEPPTPGGIHLTAEFPNIKAWSAEEPNLYHLIVELKDPMGTVIETFTQKIGFRDVTIKGRNFLVNGKRVIIYGVNRHDFNRKTGRVVSVADMRADLLEMKKFNFNAVRTSHYPNDPAFLDLADELGFYVIGEANIESHAFQDSLCNDQRYLTPWVDRVARMVQRDIHHPSVIMWSLGNESGAGSNHEAAAAYVRKFDPSRPLHYEGAIRPYWTANPSLTDVVCPMYPSIDAIISYAKSNVGTRPLIMCEYSHAMGNSNGTLAEYWQAIHTLPGLQGGFIWEFWDHGIEQTLSDGSKRSAYGGDFGEEKHDGNFCCDGMVFPDRSPKPAMLEFKTIATPLFITATSAATGAFKVKNKNFFVTTRDYEITWKIAIEGEVVDYGKVKLPVIAPQATGVIKVSSKFLKSAAEPGERFITFSIVKKSETAWAGASAEVGWAQFKLPSKARPKAKLLAPKVLTNVLNEDGSIYMGFGSFNPQLNLYRAPTDNDRIGNISKRWHEWGIDNLERTKVKITKSGNGFKVSSIYRTSAGIEIKQVQTIHEVVNGFNVVEETTLPKVLHDVARVGTSFELDRSFSHMSYFGTGPNETYPDRHLSPIDHFESDVSDQYIPYVRPQENGGHADVRWVEVSNNHGETIRIELAKPGQVSVTPYRANELATATHDVELKSSVTVVAIDTIHRGVGTASCGPDTLDQYLIKPGKYTLAYTLTYK